MATLNQCDYAIGLIAYQGQHIEMCKYIYEKYKGERPGDIFPALRPHFEKLTNQEITAISNYLRYDERGHGGSNIKIMNSALNRLHL
jgi:hypothetical protein